MPEGRGFTATIGKENLMSGCRVGQVLYPARSDFVDVTLDDAACVEDESGHFNGARG
jgi:hypothetical protein